MQNFNAALGVNCGYCHVFDGPPATNPKNDFASDDKVTKKKARVMLAMARDVNMKLQAELGKPAAELTNVQCVTCHRGVAIPKQLVTIMMETAAKDGINKAVQQYQDLRKQYYGAQAYDFSETGLLAVATRASGANKPDDALVYLRANLEYYPKSSRTYQAIAQIENTKGDKTSAIRDLEKAVELDPNNAPARAQLQQLKGQ
jgi:tetratricopeptide (TPR) repeat protein